MNINSDKIMSVCDADIYFLWMLYHSVDDYMGPASVLGPESELRRSWVNFGNAIEEVYNATFFRDGVVGDVKVVTLSE